MVPLPRFVAALMVLGLFAVGGCRRSLETPDRSPGQPCTTDEQCRPADAVCGEIYACVDLVCETEPSRTVPCPE